MEELSKAFSDGDRDKVIAKALGRVEELESQFEQVAKAAQAERDLRLTREYISKAAEYNLPVAPDELGPVLYRMAETMSYDDCAVIAKALETAGEILYEEAGYQGGGDNADIYCQVEAHALRDVRKGRGLQRGHGHQQGVRLPTRTPMTSTWPLSGTGREGRSSMAYEESLGLSR